VWKHRFEPRASTGNGEEYQITHGWGLSSTGGSKRKRQFEVYHGRIDAQLAVRRRVGQASTLAEAKAIAQAYYAKRETG
jgi:hypothetical protein